MRIRCDGPIDGLFTPGDMLRGEDRQVVPGDAGGMCMSAQQTDKSLLPIARRSRRKRVTPAHGYSRHLQQSPIKSRERTRRSAEAPSKLFVA